MPPLPQSLLIRLAIGPAFKSPGALRLKGKSGARKTLVEEYLKVRELLDK